MTVEHPTKAFFRFCPEVILLCLGLKRILAWHPAESVCQKWMVILYLRSLPALKLVCQWLCSESDSGGSSCEWHCENKKGLNRILCILEVKAAVDYKGVRYSNCEKGHWFSFSRYFPPTTITRC